MVKTLNIFFYKLPEPDFRMKQGLGNEIESLLVVDGKLSISISKDAADFIMLPLQFTQNAENAFKRSIPFCIDGS